MSLYDEALAAGAPSLEQQIRQRWGSGANAADWSRGGVDHTKALADLLRSQGVSDLSKLQIDPRKISGNIDRQEGTGIGDGGTSTDWFDKGTVDSFGLTYDGKALDRSFLGNVDEGGGISPGKDGLENSQRIGWNANGHGNTSYEVQFGPDGTPNIVPKWDSSSWTGTQEADILRMVGMAVGSYFGASALGGAETGAGASYGGGSLAEQAAINSAIAEQGGMASLGGATSYGVAPQALDASTALTGAETSTLPTNPLQTIEVTGQSLGQAPLDVTAPIGDTLSVEQLGTIPQSTGVPPVIDQAGPNYSHEGTHYTDPATTQGPGGSPINSSQFPGTPINDVNGNPVRQPVYDSNGNQIVPPLNGNNGGTQLPTNNPFGTGDFKNLFDVLSGLYGLKLANDAAAKSDPFGPYRKGYADKLQALEANPGLLRNTPGFMAGQDSINRSMASKGYLGSGNQAASLQRFSGDFYHNEANRLATLAGSNINPGQTYFNQADLVGRSLSNIGYGLSPYMQGTGGPR